MSAALKSLYRIAGYLEGARAQPMKEDFDHLVDVVASAIKQAEDEEGHMALALAPRIRDVPPGTSNDDVFRFTGPSTAPSAPDVWRYTPITEAATRPETLTLQEEIDRVRPGHLVEVPTALVGGIREAGRAYYAAQVPESDRSLVMASRAAGSTNA